MHVAHVLPACGGPSSRGLEARVAELAHGLGELGIRVDVGRAPRFVSCAGHYDLVHAHGFAALRGLATAVPNVRRLLFSPHRDGAGPSGFRSRIARARDKRAEALAARAHAAVCSSSVEARVLLQATRVEPVRVHVVPQGVDTAGLAAALPFAVRDDVVLAVGRLTRHDRLERLVAALANLGWPVQLVVLGKGIARRSLTTLAADLGVASRVTFRGEVSDHERYRWLKTARVLVALSDAERFDPVLLEAMALHTPVLASDTVAHREVAALAPSGTARFVRRPPSPLAVADAILESVSATRAPELRPGVPSRDTLPQRLLAVYEALAADDARDSRSAEWT